VKKKIILFFSISLALFLILFVFFGDFPIKNEKLMVHEACTVISEPSGGFDIFNSALSLSSVVNINYRIKGTDYKRSLGSSLANNMPSFKFDKDKLFLGVSGGRIHYSKINYKVEILNDISCQLVKSFGHEQDYPSVFNNLYTNPVRMISDRLLEMKKPIKLEELLNLGFKVVESNKNSIKIHAYPAVTIELSLENISKCDSLVCLSSEPIGQIDKMYRQYLIEDDDGKVIYSSKAEEYIINKIKFPIKISDM